MRENTQMVRRDAPDADAADRAELARHIDALMALPPQPWPSIFVVGDEVVFGITPVKRAA